MYCARCFEEITRPHFHNNKPYGSTCIRIVGGTPSKKPSKWMKVDPVETYYREAMARRGLQPWQIGVKMKVKSRISVVYFGSEQVFHDGKNFYVKCK